MDDPAPTEPVPLEGLSFDLEDLQISFGLGGEAARNSAGGCDRSSLRAGGSRNISAWIKSHPAGAYGGTTLVTCISTTGQGPNLICLIIHLQPP